MPSKRTFEPLQTPTLPCCGRHPVVERLGDTRYECTCAFCHRRGPTSRAQNAAREAWNEMLQADQVEASAPASAVDDPEIRAIMAERVARYHRGELAWQQPEAPSQERHLATSISGARYGKGKPRMKPRQDFRRSA